MGNERQGMGETAPQNQTTQPRVRRPYVRPMIIHTLQLETQAAPSVLITDPGNIDPEIPHKPDADVQQDTSLIDPALPAKPPGQPSSGGGSPVDPPLPPKP